MGLYRVTAPTDEPLTLDEAKEHLHVTGTNDDNYIAGLIAAARARAERITKRALITQTWRVTLDEFPEWFNIPKAPLRSVLSLTYLAGDGVSTPLYDSAASPQVGIADFVIDTESDPARVLLAYGVTWPTPIVQANAVSLTFEAGYGGAEDVPEDIRLAMKLMIGHWFEHRESVSEEDLKDVPQSALWILEDYRVLSVI